MSIPSTMGWRQPPDTHTPAFNAVPSRQTLARPLVSQEQAPTPASKPRKVEWSPDVREYVQRAFEPENAIEGISKAEMEEKLRQTITYFAERHMLDQVDWKNYALPQHLILEDRKSATAAAAAAAAAAARIAALNNSWMNGNPLTAQVPLAGPANNNSPSASKKRKSMDDTLTEQNDEKIPPWRKANRNTLEDRITYSNQGSNDKRQKKNDIIAANGSSKFSQADLEKRRQRFQTGKPGNRTTPPWSSPRVDSDSEFSNGPVIGTCLELEKNYFRLTAPPKPETVRPQHILEKSLELIKKKWKAENNYGYICDQLKSLRQDLTVQHIKNAFTVTVYEIHARIALEKGDLGEYNQCQTQLRALYLQKLGGHPDEFLGYRILYYIYTCNQTDMNDLLAELTTSDKQRPAVKHALDVRSALALGNYHKFFRLYLSAPNMGAYLIDMFIERERLTALANISRAYMSVNLRFLTDELGFDSDGDCMEFLQTHGAQHLVQHTGDGTRVNVKEAKTLFENLRISAFSKVDIKGQI